MADERRFHMWYVLLVLPALLIVRGAAYHHGADAFKVRRRSSSGVSGQLSPSSVAEALVYAKSDGLAGHLLPNSTVELMRFVTAYRTGIEAAVDLTPYSQLLRAAAKSGNLTWYTFIDTWVGKESPVHHMLYQNNVTGKCSLFNSSDGNGWMLDAYLSFWPPKRHVSTQPREQVMLSPGYYGGMHRIGEVAMVEGQLTDNGNSVLLDQTMDIDPNVNLVEVWGCEGEDSAHFASFIGYIARRAELFTLHNNPAGVEMVADEAFETLMWQQVSSINVTSVDNNSLIVNGTFNTSLVALKPGMPVFYDASNIFTDVNISGMWFNSSLPLHRVGNVSFVSDDGNVTLQMKYPCLPSAKFAGMPGLLVPSSPDAINRTRALVHAAKNWGIAVANQSLQNGSFGSSEKMFQSRRSSRMYLLKPDLASTSTEQALELEQPEHHNGSISLASLPLLGKVDISAKPQVVNGSKSRMPLEQRGLLGTNRSDGQKVCAVAQKQHGHLFAKRFNLSDLDSSDKVIYQLVVTGHGWSSTTEQCGEYCHAVYRLTLNGKSAANVSQFRDDCKKNPINGSVQYGTWDESRNGWCPGTVEPGLFMDLTKHSQNGENVLSVDVVVWSNATLSYEPYTDYGGFVFDDAAFLTVGLSAFIYNQSAVEAIQQQARAYTAAEAAVRHGSSHPSALRPPGFVAEPLEPEALLQLGSTASKTSTHAKAGHRSKRALIRKPRMDPSVRPALLRSDVQAEARELDGAAFLQLGASASATTGGMADMADKEQQNGALQNDTDGVNMLSDRYDFEATAPWYLYNSSEADPLQSAGTTRVTLYNQLVVMNSNRENYVNISRESLPSDWSHVALHFQLSKPGHLDYDHWDRQGSFGINVR